MQTNAEKTEPMLAEDPILTTLESRLQRQAVQQYGAQPWVKNKPADFKPQRVFLSYGHPESEICQHIYMALKARGHDPWFDKISLRAGQDWRGAIAQGVQNSQSVIACLSEHATRDGDDGHSVCLDELAIAVGAKEGRIRTVLLGPENTVRPPDLVSHIQWLDLSCWQEKLAAGPDVFEPWFAAGMRELFRLIESPESLTFAGQINTLKEILQPACDSSQRRQAELLKKGVVGREWLAQRVNAWLDDENGPPLCLLHGGPGVGKSAFSAFYTHYHPRVAAAMFCAVNQPSFTAPSQVLRTLAYLLACRLPDYRLALLRKLTADVDAIGGLQGDALQAAARPAREQLAGYSVSELFDVLFRNALPQTIDGGRPNMVILIDGLDECGGREGNALAQALSECFCCRRSDLWPRWLKVLVVARKTQEVTRWLPEAGAGGSVRWLQLNEAGAENLADIRTYFVQHLEGMFGQKADWPRALAALTERSGGYFLYAELMTDLLLQEGSLDDIDSYPEGLDGIFPHWFRRTFPDIAAYRRQFQDALGVVAFAPAPLPEPVLQDICGWGDNALANFIAPLEPLLRHSRDSFGEQTLALYHPYVAEWLAKDREGNAYYSSREDALQRLAGHFFRTVQDEAQATSDYALLWLPVILRQSPATDRRGKRAALYRELVHNGRYLSLLLAAGSRCGKQAALALPFYEAAYTAACDGAADGSDPEACLRLADCLHTLAVACLKLEDVALAFRRQNEYIDALEALAAQPPAQQTADTIRCRLADAYDDLARMYMNQYRFGMAERTARQALAMSARLRDLDPMLLCNALETLAFIRHWCNDSHREYVVYLREAALYLRYSAALSGQKKPDWLTFLLKLIDFDKRDRPLRHKLDDGDYAWSAWSLICPDISAAQKSIEALQPDPAQRCLPAPAQYKADLIEPRGRGTAITADKLSVYLARRAVQESVLARDDSPANRSALAATLQAIADTICEQRAHARKQDAEITRLMHYEELDSARLPEIETDEWQHLEALDKIIIGEESVLSLYSQAFDLLDGIAPAVREADRALQEQFVVLCWTFAKKLPPEDPRRTALARAGLEAAGKLCAQTQNHWHNCLRQWLTRIAQNAAPAAQTDALSPVRVYFTTHLQPWFEEEPDWPAALSLLCGQCGDDLFRAVLMADLLMRQGSLDAAKQAPSSLADTLRLWFGTVFPDIDRYRQEVLPLLAFVLAAPVPAAAQELWLLVKARCADETAAAGKFAEAMLQLTPLLKRSREPEQALMLSFRDPRLAEWLLSEQAGPYRADPARAKADLFDFFARRYRQGAAQMTEYEVRHLAAVFQNAADPAHYRALVQQFDWFERQMKIATDVPHFSLKDRDRHLQLLRECRAAAENALSVNAGIDWRWALVRIDRITADTLYHYLLTCGLETLMRLQDGMPAKALTASQREDIKQTLALYQSALDTALSTPGLAEARPAEVEELTEHIAEYMAETLAMNCEDPETDTAWWLDTCSNVCRLLPAGGLNRRLLRKQALAAVNSTDRRLSAAERQKYRNLFEALAG